MRRVSIAILALALASCAGTGLLQRATAKEVGLPASEIKISERARIAGGIMWKARHGEQKFVCESACEDRGCNTIDETETYCEETTFEQF